MKNKSLLIMCVCATCLFLSCNAGPVGRTFKLILYNEEGNIISNETELKNFEISVTNACDTPAYNRADVFRSSTPYTLEFYITYTDIKSIRKKKRDELSRQLKTCISLKVVDKDDKYKSKMLFPLSDYIEEGYKIIVKLEKK